MLLHDAPSLLALLHEHEILPKAALEELRPLAGPFPTAADLARELVRRGLLTPFQANEINQGRAARLVLGQYLLLERLGQGGMGEVFKARHRVLDRAVALKVIRPEFVNHPDAVERFRRECRAAGLLSHPNIVTVHDAHQAGDVHFLAMEFLDGKDLGWLLKERGLLPPGEACEYARQAALGLQHAHEKGMVHRDVKPANLMLTAGGVVKVLDLGLARLRAGADAGRPDSDLTRAGSIMGTPDYISPEQAAGETADADARADVYSLGCTLFHLLTGRPPFPGKSAREKISAHLTQPPPRVDEVRPGLHPGLSAVVRRMMEKDPATRFQSAGEVAAALQPFCGAASAPSAPVAPNPNAATVTYVSTPRDGKPRRRRVAVVAALLLGGCVLGLLAWWMLSPPPRVGAPVAGLPTNKDKDPAPPVPGPAPGPAPSPVVPPLFNLQPPPKHLVRDGLDWPPMECVALLDDDAARHWGEVHAVAFRPDGKVVATADRVGDHAYIHFWDAITLKERAAWTPAGGDAFDLAFSPDGRRLAAVCNDGLRTWDAADDGLSGERLFAVHGFGADWHLRGLLFTADGQTLLAWDALGLVRRWRVTPTGYEQGARPNPAPPRHFRFAVSADGRTLAYNRQDDATGKRLVCVTTMFDEQAAETTAELSLGVAALALSADGKRLAARVSGATPELRVWDVSATDLRLHKTVDLAALGLSNFITAFAFTPDGAKVLDVSARRGEPSTVWLFDANTGESKRLDGAADQATCVSMAADGRSIAVGGADHLLHVGDVDHGVDVKPIALGPPEPLQRLAFRPGGKELALVSHRDERRDGNGAPSNFIVWDIPLQSHVITVPGGWFTDCAYSPDGKRLFVAGTAPAAGANYREGLLRIYKREGPALPQETPPDLPKLLKGLSVEALALDRDGKTLALLGGDDANRRVGVFDVKPCRRRGDPFEVGPLIDSLALSPDGGTAATLAVKGLGRTTPIVKLWDLKSIEAGPPQGVQPDPPLEGSESQTARRLTFSPDGKTLAALVKMGPFPDDPRKVLLWDVAHGTTRAAGPSDDKKPPHVEAFAFSPDSRTLATADADGRVALWRTNKLEEMIHEWEFPGPVYSLAFDDSGTLLAAGDGDGTIAVLRLPALAP